MKPAVDQLYQEMILEHNRKPRNFKVVDPASHKAHGLNPLCGDDFHLYLDIQDDVVVDVGFQGSGCAISKASASLMSSMIKGKTRSEVEELKEKFLSLVLTEPVTDELRDQVGRLKIFEGVKQFPVRVKCATLIWRALESAFSGGQDVTTEAPDDYKQPKGGL